MLTSNKMATIGAAVPVWLAGTALLVAVTVPQGANWAVVAAGSSTFAAAVACTMLWPRTSQTVLAAALWFPLWLGLGFAVVAHTKLNANVPETSARILAFVVLTAILAQRLPGRPWVAMSASTLAAAGPGFLLTQWIPEAGLYVTYTTGLIGLFVPWAITRLRGTHSP